MRLDILRISLASMFFWNCCQILTIIATFLSFIHSLDHVMKHFAGDWWIGGTHRNGRWMWDHSGHSLSGHWDSGWPKSNGWDCVELHKVSHGAWRGELCNQGNYYVCEKAAWWVYMYFCKLILLFLFMKPEHGLVAYRDGQWVLHITIP